MSLSLTWTELPTWLYQPVMEGALSLVEAAEIWDHCLMQTEEVSLLPPRLFPAAERLTLWALDLKGCPVH